MPLPKLVPIEPDPADITTRDEQIHRMRVDGVSVRDIAHRFRVPSELVESVLDRMCIRIDAKYRADSLAIELERLDALHAVFYAKAKEGDTAAAQVVVRIAEHRASILGLYAPVRLDPVQLVEAASPPKASATDRIRATLAALTAGPRSLEAARAEAHHGPPEREREAIGAVTTLQANRAS